MRFVMPSGHNFAFPEISGHRGVRGHDVPENSIAAFLEAFRQKAGGIELDARICATGEVLVFHDKTLELLTNGKGRFRYTDFSDLRRLRLKQDGVIESSWRHVIPTLEEVLDALQPILRQNPHFLVNIEIKGKDSPLPIAEILEHRLEEGVYRPQNLLVSHFKHERLPPLQERLPEIPVGLLFSKLHRPEGILYDAAMRAAEKYGSVSIHLPVECYHHGRLAERLQHAGQIAVAWTMNEEPPGKNPDVAKKNALLVVEQGIKLITDYPREMRHEVENATPRGFLF